MKRGGPLKRKTPLQARKGLSGGKGLRRGAIKPHGAEIGVTARKTPLPKRSKAKEKALPWETAHMGAVKGQPCRACGRSGPNDAHHCYHDRATKFGGRKAPHRWTIPLCKECHQEGPQAIHKIKRTWRRMHGADWEHVPAVMTAIYGRPAPTDAEIESHWKEKGVI